MLTITNERSECVDTLLLFRADSWLFLALVDILASHMRAEHGSRGSVAFRALQAHVGTLACARFARWIAFVANVRAVGVLAEFAFLAGVLHSQAFVNIWNETDRP